MKIFISYGGPEDQVIALRLQALATVNGLRVYVPPADTRVRNLVVLGPESDQQLRDSDVVLGVVGAGLTDACRLELDAGILLRKQMIVMAFPAFAHLLQPHFPSSTIIIDPLNPGATELSVIGYLKNVHAQKTATKTALVALGSLAVGLLLLAGAKEPA